MVARRTPTPTDQERFEKRSLIVGQQSASQGCLPPKSSLQSIHGSMLFWALLASGQINMRKVDGWQTLSTKLIDQQMDIAA